MTPESDVMTELKTLLDALCEESITPEQTSRLEELVLTHKALLAGWIRPPPPWTSVRQ